MEAKKVTVDHYLLQNRSLPHRLRHKASHMEVSGTRISYQRQGAAEPSESTSTSPLPVTIVDTGDSCKPVMVGCVAIRGAVMRYSPDSVICFPLAGIRALHIFSASAPYLHTFCA
jgi:hypothetical protein